MTSAQEPTARVEDEVEVDLHYMAPASLNLMAQAIVQPNRQDYMAPASQCVQPNRHFSPPRKRRIP